MADGGETPPGPRWEFLGRLADGSPLWAARPGTPPPAECPWADPEHDVAGDFRETIRAIEEGEGWRHDG